MRLGKNSVLGENEVDFPTLKRIVLTAVMPDIMRFYDFEDFLTNLF